MSAAAITVIGGIISIIIILLYLYCKTKKEFAARAWYLDTNVDYSPEFCGLYKVYGGLPLARNTECMIAYSNGDIIVQSANYHIRIAAEDIINLRIDAIQEGYAKKMFIITCTKRVIYFLTPNIASRGFFAKKDLQIHGQLTTLPRRPPSQTLGNIISAWESDYNRRRPR
ncbi:MAG: hypothetical protein LBM98_10140 [Oscillospiraceae bacterium]|jgi:hypothetical protein|nr:hypothetical protein [Oscillospiraceae bacterium]